jgi:two-component system sensor histidine kinase UhpB
MAIPLRVLLVEDSADDAALLVRQLRLGGFDPAHERVDTAEAMSAALDAQSWDAIIADHALPACTVLPFRRREG